MKMKKIDVRLTSRKEKRYCMSCGRVIEAETFLLLEEKSGAIVQYFKEDKPFVCPKCYEEEKRSKKKMKQKVIKFKRKENVL